MKMTDSTGRAVSRGHLSHGRMGWTLAVLLVGALVLAAPAGCAPKAKKAPGLGTTSPSAAGASAAAGTDDPAALYRAGRYASAFEAAKSRAGRASGPEKERLSLVAGMSAAALDRNTDAILWLKPLMSSTDNEVAGRAVAGVGLIEAEEGRHASAVPYLSAAAEKLSGDESAKARFYLAESQAASGKNVEASSSYRAAAASASDPKLRRLANDRLSLNAFTLQLGSYRDAAKARSVATSAAARTRAAGLGAPRVVTKSLPDGRSVFAVQVGVYRDMSRAQADKAKLGGDAVVTRTKG
jgi:tetratricopeptide (TPR) repeat protein